MKFIKKVMMFLILAFIITVSGCAKAVDKTDIDDNNSNLLVNKVTDELRADFIDSINKKLLKDIADYEPNKEVGVILTFSDNSLVNDFLNTSYSNVAEYAKSKKGLEQINRINTKHNKIIKDLINQELISSVKYRYTTILDGIFVQTTYDKLSKIMKVNGVERVIISNQYNRPDAVTNDVKVYETGIFDSSDVPYTGKGTAVAILDTGCDYTHSAFTTHQAVDPLFSRSDIDGKLSKTVASRQFYDRNSKDLKVRDVYYSSKIPYGYDYADNDPDIMPYFSDHGTHVAGIIGGYDEVITGVAIDTQLIIMKVFSDFRDGAEDGDILAALEDSVLLGVDAINMSLGTPCGFTREVDEIYKNAIYDSIEAAGISLVVAASNDYSSGYGSDKGNTNKATNPDSGTVGAPSTYHAALSVASISGVMDKYMLANGEQTVFFLESFNASAKEYNFYEMLGVTSNQPVVYEYVTVPGYGLSANYMGIDVRGKIALVKRGDISFEEKVQFAYEAGAIACIVYNNVIGDIVMTVGNNVKIPVVSISKDDGVKLAEHSSGKIEFNMKNLAGPFMSDFSSWGPTPSLELKPEVTAHGGNILSAIPGGGYDKLSGTSMAAPNMAGITILIRQYVKEKFPNFSTVEIRDMVNQLSTSTATIILDRNGNPYSPRKQGAGLASLFNSVNTGAYLTVDGKNTAKLELGDDPQRTGEFEFSFKIKNITGKDLSYDLSSIIMTESLSSSDEEYVAEMAYLLEASTTFEVENGSLNGKHCVVSANSECVVKGKINLSSEDKRYINRYFENGMYVEGFIKLTSTSNDVDLSIPILAFYGDWGYAPLFDMDYYEEETEAHNNAIDEDDKKKADYYATTPLGKYYYDYIIPLGSYVYEMDESKYNMIPATRDKAAISYYADCISGVYAVFTGLLRGAKEMNLTVVNTVTGEVVWENTEYNCYKAHYGGTKFPYVAKMDIEAGAFGWDNNSHYEVTMTAKLDWDTDTENENSTYQFSFYVDYEAPTVKNAYYYKEYDRGTKQYHYYVDLTVFDNHYVQSVRPVALYTNSETGKLTYTSLTDYPIPVYQKSKGEETIVTIEITDYIDLITETNLQEGLAFHIDDYAMNSNFYYISLPELDSKNIAFTQQTMEIKVGDSVELFKHMTVIGKEEVNQDYFKNLKWTSTNENVVKVGKGEIEAVGEGVATINCESITTGKKVSIVITVKGVNDNSTPPLLEDLKFTSYKTLFAFESDNDISEISSTGSLNFFDGTPRIACYPTESVRLHYALKPWNLDESRYELEYSSSNERVATVDQNGVVTAVDEGTARISLRITIDGRTSTMVARCTVTVKNPFIVENRVLTEYKGAGGEVVIPEDLGIMYIGAFAFCHYTVDNEIEADDDDFDKKKIPYGNDTITSIVIPEGVEEIQKYAFYNCSALVKVTLPESCRKIFEYAFYDNRVLEEINLDSVTVIGASAFYNCEYLTNVNTAKANTIGEEAFANCKQIKSVDLRELKRSGVNAFANCVRLSTVLFGEWTKLSDGMFTNTRITEAVIYSTNIPDNLFDSCKQLTKVIFENDLVYLGSNAFKACTNLMTVEFKGAVEYIGSGVFNGCGNLRSLTLPSSDVELADYAFQNCGLQEIIFSENTRLVNTGAAVFRLCSNLETFKADNSKYYTVRNKLLYTKDLKTLILVPIKSDITIYNVPSSLEYIGDNAFSGNNTLLQVIFGNDSKIKGIGNNAFAECEKLFRVQLPNKDIEIGEYAFFYCLSLATVNINNVTNFGEYAFSYTPLSNITIGSDAIINEGTFYNTPRLVTVKLGRNVKIGFGAFSDSGVITVDMPTEGGVEIAERAFFKCKTLVNIDLTKATGTIGDYAFYNCTKLSKVELKDITEIGKRAFSDCTGIKTVILGDKLERIGESAFASYSVGTNACIQITSIVLPDTLKYIGADAFYDCYMLTSIDLNNVEEIGIQAFAYCTSLVNVTLGTNLKVLDDSIFYGCESLVNINLENVEKINQYTFFKTALESINLENVVEIGSGAFNNCQNLMFVNAPKLEKIGSGAFHTTNLNELVFPSLKEVSTQAFYGVKAEEFLITDNLNQVDYAAFVGLDKLNAFYTLENGQKVYDKKYQNVILSDGVLYTILPTGYYQLAQYPVAKTDHEYTVLENTARIEYFGAAYNSYLEKVILPTTLKNIGNFAFYGCEKLSEVVFKSYYAPVLEGTMTVEVTVTKDTFSKFDELYKYDYYYFETGQIFFPYYYQNFIDVVGSNKVGNLTYVYPENNSGYNGFIYSAYFEDKLDENGERITSGYVMDRYAIDFINAMAQIGDKVTLTNRQKIMDAVTYYNALLAHPEQLQYVDQNLIDEIKAKQIAINVLVMEDIINRLYEVDRSKYSYDRIRNAVLTFNRLTDVEKGLVANKDKLSQKELALREAMEQELDWEKEFIDYEFIDKPINPPSNGNKLGLIIGISIGAVALLAAAGFGLFMVQRKRGLKNE